MCFTDDMSNMSNFERLIEFHRQIDGTVPSNPRVPDGDTLRLRCALLEEEYEELMAAIRRLLNAREAGEEADITELTHELVDLLYVTYGTILKCGVDADEVFEEVHRANMRKLTGPKRADGKQLKPEGWRPADVAGVIERQSGGGD